MFNCSLDAIFLYQCFWCYKSAETGILVVNLKTSLIIQKLLCLTLKFAAELTTINIRNHRGN